MASKRTVKDPQIELARRLVARLERLSADSYWAHQASGIRGALLRILETRDPRGDDLDTLVNAGYAVLVKAAKSK